jgi:hypothetical protein
VDLALPRIDEAAQPVRSAANEIDVAGAKFANAADKTANVLAEHDKAKISVQTQEATLRATKGLDTLMHAIQSNPDVDPDNFLGNKGVTIEQYFGGEVPGLAPALVEPVPGQEGKTQRKKVVKMADIAPQIFDHASGIITSAAAGSIEEAPWQRNFARAMEKDVEAKRVQMLDWQKGQYLRDAEVMSEAQLKRAGDAQNWNLYRAIIDNGSNGMDSAKRVAYREQLPYLVTEANISNRLKSRDPEELDKLRDSIMANEVSKDPEHDGGFATKLSPQQQAQLGNLVSTRKMEILHENEWQRKVAQEKLVEQTVENMQWAYDTAQKQNVPISSIFSISDIPYGTGQHFENLKRFYDSLQKPPRTESDSGAWLALSGKEKDGTLAAMSKAEMMAYWPYLTPEHQRTWMDRWANAKAGGKPPFSSEEYKLMDAYLRSKGFDEKKDENAFNTQKALLEQNLLVWRKRNPSAILNYNLLKSEAASTFNQPETHFWQSSKTSNWVKNNLADSDTESALAVALGAVTPGKVVSVQDLATHAAQMEKESPQVEEAWTAYNPAQALTGTQRAIVHGMLLLNEKTGRVDNQLTDQGITPSPKARIQQIVRNMQIPQSREQAAKNAADAEAKAKGQQTRASGERQNAAYTSEMFYATAEEKAARQAEREAYLKLPEWQQRATTMEKDEVQSSDDALYAQVIGRLKSEDLATQRLNAKGKGFRGQDAAILGDRFPDDPVRKAMEQRARDEVKRDGASARQAIQEKYGLAKERYAALKADFDRGDPETVALFNKHGLDRFSTFIDLWMKGTVR